MYILRYLISLREIWEYLLNYLKRLWSNYLKRLWSIYLKRLWSEYAALPVWPGRRPHDARPLLPRPPLLPSQGGGQVWREKVTGNRVRLSCQDWLFFFYNSRVAKLNISALWVNVSDLIVFPFFIFLFSSYDFQHFWRRRSGLRLPRRPPSICSISAFSESIWTTSFRFGLRVIQV